MPGSILITLHVFIHFMLKNLYKVSMTAVLTIYVQKLGSKK